MRGFTRVVVIGLALGACTSFDEVDRLVCGNGVLEPGEDCDSSAASCVRCAVTCTTAADCPTTDYACGVDGVCHAPGGALGAPEPAGAFQVNDLTITDLDGDGIGDAFGVSRTSISVRYGDPGARLTRHDTLLTPSQTGNAGFGDLDADAITDLAIPTEDGLVAYTSKFGSLAPLAVSSPIIDDVGSNFVDIKYVFTVSRLTIAGYLLDGNGNVHMFVFGFLDALLGLAPITAQPCLARLGNVPAAQFAPGTIDIYKANDSDLVVSMIVEAPTRRLCVVSLHQPPFGRFQIADITPGNAIAPAQRPVLADLDADADPCPDLVNPDGGGLASRRWGGANTANGCVLAPAVSPAGVQLPPFSAQEANLVVGRLPLVPSIGGYASDMLVVSDGVMAFEPGGMPKFVRAYTSQRRLAGADSADLDGDGQVDGVLIPAMEDDLDLLFRRPNSVIPLIPGYLVLKIDTASRVITTDIADYDGDGRLDVAYVEQLTDYQRAAVSYATSTLLQPPVPVGAFQSVVTIASVGLPSSEDTAATTDDLFVLQPPPPGKTVTQLTLLHGSALRTMTPFFDPREDIGQTSARKRTTIRDVIIGQFAAPASGTDYREVVALAVGKADMPTAPLMWRMNGTPNGPDATEVAGTPTSGMADCAANQGSGLCVADAQYLTWPLANGNEIVIGIDRAVPTHAVRFDPRASGVAAPLAAVTAKVPAMTVPRSLSRADTDGDGDAELVIALAPRAGTQARGAVLVCAMTDGSATDCEDVVPAVIDAAAAAGTPAMACIDAVPARITAGSPLAAPAARADLVVACRGNGTSLYRVHRGEAGYEVSLLARTETKLDALRVGDVTGDGVDDVLALEGESGARSLLVFPQCTSRDLTGCQRVSTATMGGGS